MRRRVAFLVGFVQVRMAQLGGLFCRHKIPLWFTLNIVPTGFILHDAHAGGFE